MKVLCYAPNNAVWRYTFPQAQWLEILKQRGDEIVYAYCDHDYESFCMSMAAFQVGVEAPAEKKQAVCRRCVANAHKVAQSFGFSAYSVNSFVTAEDRATAHRLARTARTRVRCPASSRDLPS